MICKNNRRCKILTILTISAFVLLFMLLPDDFMYETFLEKQQRFSSQCRNKFEIVKIDFLGDKYDEVEIGRHPNLPDFLAKSPFRSSFIPEISRIRWSGIVYQESWKESPKFLLYSAHFDSRSNSGLENIMPIVRSEVDVLNPYGIHCQVPQVQNRSQVPIAVSLVKRSCKKPSNILKIFGSPLKKNNVNFRSNNPKIGICGKALFYYNEDFSHRLIEWIEIMRILGVSNIFLYKTTCHKNVVKVLDFYEKSGFVKLVTFYYPPPYVHEGTFVRLWSKQQIPAYRKAQKIYLNDCILRNKDDFDYLGVFDSDEIPTLRKHKTLQDFIKFSYGISKPSTSFFLKWKHFYVDLSPGPSALEIPESFYNLRHNQRTKLNGKEAKVLEDNGKTIYDTSNYVSWIGSHMPLDDDRMVKTVDRDIAYTAHYGNKLCQKEITCRGKELEEENALIFYKERIIENVLNISIQIFGKE